MGDLYEVSAEGSMSFDGNLNPQGSIEVAITGDEDNWNPTGLATASRIVVDCTGNNDITGIEAPTSTINQTIMIINVGSGNLKLEDSGTSSDDENKIINNDNKDIELKNGGGVTLTYVHSEERWFSLMDKK
jgi:hypothetical protein